jgi:hypothetical protein
MSGGNALAFRLRKAINGRPVYVVAEAAGFDRRGLERAVSGQSKRGMYADTLASIARATGVRVSWLAFGEGEP